MQVIAHASPPEVGDSRTGRVSRLTDGYRSHVPINSRQDGSE
jgi:hypothetical protein